MTKKYVLYGPPGTGKTTELQRIMRGCVEKYGGENIVATSFSKTAAKEIASPRGDDAPLDIPDDHIGTMHALCYRLLGKPKVAEKEIEDFITHHKQYAISDQQKRTLNLDEPEADQLFETNGDAIMSRYVLLRNRMIPREIWPQSVKAFAHSWEEWKTEKGYIDFTDMIEQVFNDPYGHIPFNASVLIGDEGQDLTPLQHALFDKWSQQAEYTVIAGDDDQTIFGHTGATAEAFLDPSIPDTHKKVLSQSRRVPRKVQAVAESWIRKVRVRHPKQYNPRDAEGVVRSNDATWRNPAWAIADAQKQIDAGRSVMFLASCSYMLKPTIDELREKGLPFANPWRLARGDWNPLPHFTQSKTMMADRLRMYLRPKFDDREDAPIWSWLELDKWSEHLKASGVFVSGAKAEIGARSDDKMARGREVDFDELAKLMTPQAYAEAFEYDANWLFDHMLTGKQETMRYPLRVLDSQGWVALDSRRNPPLISIGTIHSVKGAEADVIYLFPDISRASAREFLNYGDGHDAIIRQFYVGITRAREELVVCRAASKDAVELPLNAATEKMKGAA